MKILVTGVGGQLGYDVCKVLDARKIENKGALIWRILTSRTHRQRMIILPHTVRMRLFTVRRGLPWTRQRTNWTRFVRSTPKVHVILRRPAGRSARKCCTSRPIMCSPGTGERFYEPDDPTGLLGAYGATKAWR